MEINETKTKYICPEIEVIHFSSQDVIAVSTDGFDNWVYDDFEI